MTQSAEQFKKFLQSHNLFSEFVSKLWDRSRLTFFEIVGWSIYKDEYEDMVSNGFMFNSKSEYDKWMKIDEMWRDELSIPTAHL